MDGGHEWILSIRGDGLSHRGAWSDTRQVRHRFFESTRPLVFAHRGGAALAPENTMAACANGLAAGADGLELDVRLSRDGRVVVHHDRTLDRTTALTGPIGRRSADELNEAAVPLLSDVLARHRDARVIIELKENRPEMARAVVEVVRAPGAVERVCVGSFGRHALYAVRALEPAIATSAAREEVRWALYRSWCRWPVSRVAYSCYQVPEWSGRTHVVTPLFVRGAHGSGLPVQVGSVGPESAARRLLDWR